MIDIIDTGYQITRDDFSLISSVGCQISSIFPKIPNCCAAMSALWAEEIRKTTKIPTYLVAGCLDFQGRRVFGNDTLMYINPFSISNLEWDGHCWVVFGNVIGDASFFRTTCSPRAPAWLKEMVWKSFSKDHGLILGELDALQNNWELKYQALHVATDIQIEAVINGAVQIIKDGKLPIVQQ